MIQSLIGDSLKSVQNASLRTNQGTSVIINNIVIETLEFYLHVFWHDFHKQEQHKKLKDEKYVCNEVKIIFNLEVTIKIDSMGNGTVHDIFSCFNVSIRKTLLSIKWLNFRIIFTIERWGSLTEKKIVKKYIVCVKPIYSLRHPEPKMSMKV